MILDLAQPEERRRDIVRKGNNGLMRPAAVAGSAGPVVDDATPCSCCAGRWF